MKSFSLLELIIVIILIGILSFSINIFIPDNRLQMAADNLVKNIHFTQSLALKNDKYQPFPNHVCDDTDEGKIECNRSKYWFKQWWQVRFTGNKNDNNLWYEVFSDQPYSDAQNFDRKGTTPSSLRDISIAKNPFNNKYLIGKCGSGFPSCDEIDKTLSLTEKYGIKTVMFDGKKVSWNQPKRLIFDNYGNVFLSEGKIGDGNDINPLDKDNRELLTKKISIKLCLDENCENLSKERCIQVNVTPTGFVYISSCK